MAKIILPYKNSTWGVKTNSVGGLFIDHAINWKDEQTRDSWISKEFFNSQPLETLLQTPFNSLPLIRDTSTTINGKFNLDWYNETMGTNFSEESILNLDFLIAEIDNKKYFYIITEMFKGASGSRNSKTFHFSGSLDIFLTYNRNDIFQDVEDVVNITTTRAHIENIYTQEDVNVGLQTIPKFQLPINFKNSDYADYINSISWTIRYFSEATGLDGNLGKYGISPTKIKSGDMNSTVVITPSKPIRVHGKTIWEKDFAFNLSKSALIKANLIPSATKIVNYPPFKITNISSSTDEDGNAILIPEISGNFTNTTIPETHDVDEKTTINVAGGHYHNLNAIAAKALYDKGISLPLGDDPQAFMTWLWESNKIAGESPGDFDYDPDHPFYPIYQTLCQHLQTTTSIHAYGSSIQSYQIYFPAGYWKTGKQNYNKSWDPGEWYGDEILGWISSEREPFGPFIDYHYDQKYDVHYTATVDSSLEFLRIGEIPETINNGNIYSVDISSIKNTILNKNQKLLYCGAIKTLIRDGSNEWEIPLEYIDMNQTTLDIYIQTNLEMGKGGTNAFVISGWKDSAFPSSLSQSEMISLQWRAKNYFSSDLLAAMPENISAYQNWLVNNGNQFNIAGQQQKESYLQAKAKNKLSAFTSFTSNVLSGVGSAMAGNAIGTGASAASAGGGLLASQMNSRFIDKNYQLQQLARSAQKQDLRNAGASINGGSSAFENVINESKIYLDVEVVSPLDLTAMNTHLEMFGHSQNGILKSLNDIYQTKKLYNYVQTGSIFENINGRLSSDIKQQISNFFESGITLWHLNDISTFEGIKNYDFTHNTDDPKPF